MKRSLSRTILVVAGLVILLLGLCADCAARFLALLVGGGSDSPIYVLVNGLIDFRFPLILIGLALFLFGLLWHVSPYKIPEGPQNKHQEIS